MNQICSSVNFYLNLIAVIIVFPALDFPADDGAIGKRQDSIVIAECRVDDLFVTTSQEHQHHGDNEEDRRKHTKRSLSFHFAYPPYNSIDRLVISVQSRMTLIRCIHLQHSHDGIVCEIEQRITNGLIRNLLLVTVIAGKAGQGLEAGELIPPDGYGP